MEPLKNKVYFDGQHKTPIYGVRRPIIDRTRSQYIQDRMKQFIQVKILFIGKYYMWINILSSELVKIK